MSNGASTIPLPPQEFIDAVGGGDYLQTATHIFELVRDRAGLLPDHRILDVGCGCGRMAAPLTQYLTPSGRYDGIDIVLPMIEWCRENISRQYPHFHFHQTALANTYYSPQGGGRADAYKFPFDSETFDVVSALSLFTHLLPHSAAQYAREVARVLKPQGVGLLTFFLLNEEYPRVRGLPWVLQLEQRIGEGYAVCDVTNPEYVVGFDEDYAFRELRRAGLAVNVVGYGGWTYHPRAWSYQDVIVVTKAQSRAG